MPSASHRERRDQQNAARGGLVYDAGQGRSDLLGGVAAISVGRLDHQVVARPERRGWPHDRILQPPDVDARSVAIAGAGHLPWLDEPEATGEAVEAALADSLVVRLAG